jgi:hypothetical protein
MRKSFLLVQLVMLSVCVFADDFLGRDVRYSSRGLFSDSRESGIVNTVGHVNELCSMKNDNRYFTGNTADIACSNLYEIPTWKDDEIPLAFKMDIEGIFGTNVLDKRSYNSANISWKSDIVDVSYV